jgi:TraB family protein
MKKTYPRPPLAVCYRVETPNKKVSYLLLTQHSFYQYPKELEQLEIARVLVETDFSKIPSALPRLRLDERIATMAHKKGIPVISLDDNKSIFMKQILSEVDESNGSDLDNLFEPGGFKHAHILLNDIISKDNYYATATQDLKKLDSQASSVSTELEQKIVFGRNSQWEKTILENLDMGGTLVAVGLIHILAKGGYRDTLPKNGYKLTEYPVTLKIDIGEIDKGLEELPSQPLSELLFKEMKKDTLPIALKLRQLIIDYHQQKLLTSAQKRRINECIYRSLVEGSYINLLENYSLKKSIYLSGYSLLNYYSKNIHLLFPGMSAKEIQQRVFGFFAAQEKLKINWIKLAERHRIAFVISLFFPDIANNLFKMFFESKLDQSAELFLLFGASIDKTNKEQVDFYEKIMQGLSEEKPPSVKKDSAPIKDKNIPDWLVKTLKQVFEKDCYFIEDIDQKLFDEHLPQLKKDEINGLVKLFDQYKHVKEWQKEARQVKILLQKILLALAAPPYRKESAILALTHYYDSEINNLQQIEEMYIYTDKTAYKESLQDRALKEFYNIKKNIFFLDDERIEIKTE